ncbi:hypothetical protein CCHR01_20026 [Colletotrichum chrysophilum]|uniref:Uncharacterized protein n=1 Tax=Colletotrichum chrysophilum TaxID=1836956 RepID=A0AAD8ZX98_9PEZI|nr:hypothetical protein CCHR01_20026 [Colletotrichum chrysophilum]
MISGAQKETLSDQLVMPTDRDHLVYLGDHPGMDKEHCSGLTSIALQQSTCDYHYRYFQLTFTANYLLSLRLITLASET